MKATEIFGEAKYPYLRMWGGDDLDRTLTGGVIIGIGAFAGVASVLVDATLSVI